MIQRNRDSMYEVDCRTVTGVRIADMWIHVRYFTVGQPVFGIPDAGITTASVYSYGGDMHPLSYFIEDADGHCYTGPYHHIQQMRYVPDIKEA